MSKTIHLEIKQAPEQLIQQARAAAGSYGVTVRGNASDGHFVGAGIEGRYCINDQTLAITILKKPMAMPWFFIEKSVSDFFS